MKAFGNMAIAAAWWNGRLGTFYIFEGPPAKLVEWCAWCEASFERRWKPETSKASVQNDAAGKPKRQNNTSKQEKRQTMLCERQNGKTKPANKKNVKRCCAKDKTAKQAQQTKKRQNKTREWCIQCTYRFLEFFSCKHRYIYLPPKRVVKSSRTFFQRGTATQRQG